MNRRTYIGIECIIIYNVIRDIVVIWYGQLNGYYPSTVTCGDGSLFRKSVCKALVTRVRTMVSLMKIADERQINGGPVLKLTISLVSCTQTQYYNTSYNNNNMSIQCI